MRACVRWHWVMFDLRTGGALSSCYAQEMVFEAAAQAGKKLAFHAKRLQRSEEGEPTPGGDWGAGVGER